MTEPATAGISDVLKLKKKGWLVSRKRWLSSNRRWSSALATCLRGRAAGPDLCCKGYVLQWETSSALAKSVGRETLQMSLAVVFRRWESIKKKPHRRCTLNQHNEMGRQQTEEQPENIVFQMSNNLLIELLQHAGV